MHSKSGIRTRLRFTSFHSFVSREPRSNSTIVCPCWLRSSRTARVPIAPRTIFSKKLESGLKAILAMEDLVQSNAMRRIEHGVHA